MPEDAFQETTDTPRKSAKSLKLSLNADGSIDWESSLDKHKEAFIKAIEIDPNGILQNIQEQAGETPDAHPNPTGVADATVLATTNLVMASEAILISIFGKKLAPPLQFVHPVVAIKACAVSLEEIQPILEPGKRLIKRYIPDKFLKQEYQDIAVCAQFLAELSVAKFKACVDLGLEIQKRILERANGQAGNVSVTPPPAVN